MTAAGIPSNRKAPLMQNNGRLPDLVMNTQGGLGSLGVNTFQMIPNKVPIRLYRKKKPLPVSEPHPVAKDSENQNE